MGLTVAGAGDTGFCRRGWFSSGEFSTQERDVMKNDLYVVCHVTSEMVFDADDVPYVNSGVCRSWSASDEDNPLPDLRLFVVFNREPRDFEEAILVAKACLNPDEAEIGV